MSKPVFIFSDTGILIFSAKSSLEAQKIIGCLSNSTVYLYLDNKKYYFSSKLNKNIYLRSSDKYLSLDNFQSKPIVINLSNTNPINIPELNLDELSKLFLYIYNDQFVLVFTCFTYTEIYKYLYPLGYRIKLKNDDTFSGVSNAIRHRVNLDSPIIAENNNIFYIIKNPGRGQKNR